MRLATRVGCLATSRIIGAPYTTTTSVYDAVGLQPAAPPAALYDHTVVRPRMVVAAILTDVLQRLNVVLSSVPVVDRIAMWFTRSDDILLPDTLIYTYIYIYSV